MELHLDPLELSTAMTALKMKRGLSYLRYTCPNSNGHQGCLLAHGSVAEVSTKLPLEPGVLLHYGFPGDPSSKHPGCHPWHRQSTTLGRPHRMCKPRIAARCVWEGGAQEHPTPCIKDILQSQGRDRNTNSIPAPFLP